MPVVVRSGPKKNGHSGNYCAYCHYWEGDSKLCSFSAASVKFDISATGRCMVNGKRIIQLSGAAACRDFKLCNDASKYAR